MYEEGSKEFRIPVAEDYDRGENGSIRYWIQNKLHDADNECRFLLIEPNGSERVELLFQTTSSLDRELLEGCSFSLMAADEGNPSISTTILVKVSVLDINDEYPRFLSFHYEINVSELELPRVLLRVQAEDPDIIDQENGLEYRISPFSYSKYPSIRKSFSLDPRTGAFSLIGKLDFEKVSMYLLALQVFDNKNIHSSEATLKINVLNENDNSPDITLTIFSEGLSNSEKLVVMENLPEGLPLALVKVFDVDSGGNGIFCTLGDSVHFMLREFRTEMAYDRYKTFLLESGRTPFDRESWFVLVQSRFASRLRITCNDGDIPNLETTIYLYYEVADTNDETPIFSQLQYFVNVSENIAYHSKLLTVQAYDKDFGQNGQVIYSLSSDLFFINALNGTIYTKSTLDRETLLSDRIFLEVFAIDCGRPSLTGTATIIVRVIGKSYSIGLKDLFNSEIQNI